MTRLRRIPSWGCSRFGGVVPSPSGGLLAVADYNYGVWLFKRDAGGDWQRGGGFMTPAEGHWAAWDATRPYAYAFPTFGSQMRVFDCRQPSQPREVAQFWLERWTDQQPAAIGHYLVVPQLREMAVLDVADPQHPVEHARWTLSPRKDSKKKSVSGCRVLALPADGLLLCVWIGSSKWQHNGAWLEVKRLVAGGFKTVSRVQLRAEVVGGGFPPRLVVEGERLYVNDACTNELSVWKLDRAGGGVSLVGRLSTKGWELSRAFNMQYPGLLGVHKGIVYLLNSGQRPARKTLIHVVDTTVRPFKRLAELGKEWGGSYVVDARVIADNLCLGTYGGSAWVFKLSREGREPVFVGQFSAGEMSWTMGGVNAKGLIAWPGLYHLKVGRMK